MKRKGKMMAIMIQRRRKKVIINFDVEQRNKGGEITDNFIMQVLIIVSLHDVTVML
jgi:hypothetical protein